jgi:agmatinase
MDFGDRRGTFVAMTSFLGEECKPAGFEQARAVVVPLPVEFSTSYGKGTAAGPRAILDASAYVELYDEELDLEIGQEGIHTLEELKADGEPAVVLETITSRIADLLQHNKFVMVLGGEHSISAAVYKAYHTRFRNISVVQLDAHSDLRMEYENSPYSHASVMRRIWELNKNIVQVGIRAQCSEERDFIRQNKIPVFYAHQLIKRGFTNAIINKLQKNVYLTIDVDFLDPSIMPSTGTPEPGGFFWYETLDFLRRIFEKRNVLGCDLVEFSPLPGIRHPDFLAAKLVAKILGFHFMEKNNR